MTEPRPRALFLDLDGTLADSLPAMRAVYAAFLAEHGRTGSDGEFDSLNGPALPEIVGVLRERHGLAPAADALERRYRALIAARYARDSRPAPGARELLACARGRGVPVWVVTSAERPIAEEFLAVHDLAASIAAVVTAEGLPRSKPDPAIYRRALALAAVGAGDAWAVEDSPNGWRAATAAGICTFALAPASGPVPEGPSIRPVASLRDLVPLLEAAA
jgi:HAD superfamily hydrolase (TIGR01509 family)